MMLNRASSLTWKTGAILRHGIPKKLISFEGGIGDDLLCTAVLRELGKRGQSGIWMMSGNPTLFRNNSDAAAIVPHDVRYYEIAKRLGATLLRPHYAAPGRNADTDVIPNRHLIETMCRAAGITGEIALRPYINLEPKERYVPSTQRRLIAIQSTAAGALFPMKNKEWFPQRFQEVVDALNRDYHFVQLGSANDPPLTGVEDLRGKTSIRETAAILAGSHLFIGLVGFLMHAARAVECRSVIVYGGRELESQSGYPCNANLSTALECSPCWQWNDCHLDRKCMREIVFTRVVEAAHRMAEQVGQPLETETAFISAGSPKRQLIQTTRPAPSVAERTRA